MKQPLIGHEEKEGQSGRRYSYAIIVEYSACIIVAIPTATLNGLAAISGNATRLGALKSPNDLKELLEQAKIGQIIYGGIAFSASEVVLTFLNKRYLLASGKAAVDLLRRVIKTLKAKWDQMELRESDRAGAGESLLFAWSITTSLIFAEIGGEALSFLGTPGEDIGVLLSLIVYFATRYASAKIYFAQLADENFILKQKYHGKLELLQLDIVDIKVPLLAEESDTNQALREFLNRVDNTWESLPKDNKRVFFLYYTAPILGWILVVTTAMPIMVSFIPSSVQGAETITHQNIGKDTHYQSIASFTFGAFATALTLFFYELNIKDLPKHFLKTALLIYEKIRDGDISGAMKLFGLTLAAFGSSYFTGIGFKFVADSAISSGYLSYIGSWLRNMIPDGLLTGVVAMLWSHLQDLINQTTQKSSLIETTTVTQIDKSNVRALLAHPSTDVSALRANRYAFHQPPPPPVNHSAHNKPFGSQSSPATNHIAVLAH